MLFNTFELSVEVDCLEILCENEEDMKDLEKRLDELTCYTYLKNSFYDDDDNKHILDLLGKEVKVTVSAKNKNLIKLRVTAGVEEYAGGAG